MFPWPGVRPCWRVRVKYCNDKRGSRFITTIGCWVGRAGCDHDFTFFCRNWGLGTRLRVDTPHLSPCLSPPSVTCAPPLIGAPPPLAGHPGRWFFISFICVPRILHSFNCYTVLTLPAIIVWALPTADIVAIFKTKPTDYFNRISRKVHQHRRQSVR